MAKSGAPTHFNSYNAYLRQRFGGRVAKLSIDLGIPCPHRSAHPPGCTYCTPGVIMTDRIGSLGSVTAQINAGVQKVGARYRTDLFLAYFQNETNTAGDTVWLLDRYDEAISHPKVRGIIISTRPDAISETLLDLLAARAWRKPVFLEYGLQSVHDETLKSINRGHDYDCFVKTVKATHKRKLPVAAHVIMGLPGESPEMMVETFRKLGSLPVDSLKIHHLQVYRNSPMELPYLKDQVRLFASFDDYCPILVDCLEVLPWRVKIQRFVADAPTMHLVGPKWMGNKNEMIAALEGEFIRRKSRQGQKADPGHAHIGLL